MEAITLNTALGVITVTRKTLPHVLGAAFAFGVLAGGVVSAGMVAAFLC